MMPRNPFPSQATINLEVRTGERPGVTAPYLPLSPFEAAIAKLETATARMIARARLPATAEPPPGELDGKVIAIRGPHGTGKTRLMAKMMSSLSSTEGTSMLVLYAKCDIDGPAEVLRRLLAQVTFADYRQTLYSAQIAVTLGAAPKQTSNEFSSRTSPAELEPIYSSYAVGRDVVDARLRDRSPSLSRDDEFRTAISLSQEAALIPIVHQWMIGGALDNDFLRTIGAKRALSSAEDLLSAICVILSLRAQARLPTFVFLDQIEHIADDATGLHVIRTLAEWVPIYAGLLVLAGNDTVYGRLAADLIQRFEGQICLRGLTEVEAEKLIRIYLESTHVFFLKDYFEPDAIKAIFQITSGNPRRLLQLCHKCFDIADGQKITRTRVEQAALPAGISMAAIVDHLRSIVDNNEYDIHEIDPEQLGSRDCVIVDGSGAVTAWVFIRASEFYLDETKAILEAIRNARTLAVGHPIVFVTAGYVSAEIKRLMEAESIDYVEYDPWNLEKVIRATALDGRRQRLAGKIAAAGEVEAKLVRVEEALTSLGERRDVDLALLDRDVKAAAKPEIAGWSAEKASILKLVGEARSSRVSEAVRVFVAEHREARRFMVYMLGKIILGLGGLGVAAIGIARIFGVRLLYDGLYDIIIIAAFAALLAAMASAILALFRNLTGRSWNMTLSESDNLDKDKLEIVARRVVRNGRENTQSRDPLLRLAAALKMKGKWDDSEDIISLIKTETSSIVKRELMLALSSAPREVVISSVLSLCDEHDSSYLVEVIVRVFPELPESIVDIESSMLRILFAVYGHKPRRWLDHEPDLLYCLVARHVVDPMSHQLCRAFYDDDELALLDVVKRISNQRLEDMAAQLSPFRPDGLGAMDGLRRIRQIENYYMFVRQLLFMREQLSKEASRVA